MTPTATVLGTILFYFAYGMDVIANWTLFSLVALDWPREFTITSHLNRILRDNPEGWSRSVAVWFCKNLLNPFDHTGRHCIACKELPEGES